MLMGVIIEMTNAKGFMKECKLCSEIIRYDYLTKSNIMSMRRFVLDSDKENTAVCTHCGYTIGVTDKELKFYFPEDEYLNIVERRLENEN